MGPLTSAYLLGHGFADLLHSPAISRTPRKLQCTSFEGGNAKIDLTKVPKNGKPLSEEDWENAHNTQIEEKKKDIQKLKQKDQEHGGKVDISHAAETKLQEKARVMPGSKGLTESQEEDLSDALEEQFKMGENLEHQTLAVKEQVALQKEVHKLNKMSYEDYIRGLGMRPREPMISVEEEPPVQRAALDTLQVSQAGQSPAAQLLTVPLAGQLGPSTAAADPPYEEQEADLSGRTPAPSGPLIELKPSAKAALEAEEDAAPPPWLAPGVLPAAPAAARPLAATAACTVRRRRRRTVRWNAFL